MSTAVKPSDYVSSEISGEHFISEHTFFFVKKGITKCYDGNKTYIFKSGDFGLVRKNRLSKYSKDKENMETETTFIIFDEVFLKKFQKRYRPAITAFKSNETFLRIPKNKLVSNFIQSLAPYCNENGKIDETFADLKREELLLIILKSQPELAEVFFDFGIPEKINLEEFMNKNFTFNVNIERFAYLTGRSLSAFKRDFMTTFNDTPSRWLIKKRLQEAHFLIEKKQQRPSDIYLELGFETLSHFSYAFKKQFGQAPTEFIKPGKKNSR